MKKSVLKKLAKFRERGLYAAKWLRDRGWGSPMEDITNYIVELEAALSGADSTFFRYVIATAPIVSSGSGITIKKDKVDVNGLMIDGIKVEIGADVDVDPIAVLKKITEQMENERRKAEGDAGNTDTQKAPDTSDKGKDEGVGEPGEAPDEEPDRIKVVGKPTVH